MASNSYMAGLGQAMGSSFGTSFANYGGSGLGGALFGGITARRQWKYQQKQMRLQQQYALEQMAKSAEYQLAHDKEMFDYENAYNDPSKVFERYLKAGVTPAAVLGSSGVGVSATVPTSSGGAPSGGSVSGGAPIDGSFAVSSGDPLAAARAGLVASERERNEAAADRDRAEADRARGDTHSAEWRKAMDDLDLSIRGTDDLSADVKLDLLSAQRDIEKVNAWLTETTSGYALDEIISRAGILKEEYYNIRGHNDYLDEYMSASIALLKAQYVLTSAQAELQQISVQDAQKWFQLNWNTKIPVPDVDENGKPNGKVIEMTGEEMQKVLLGLSLTSGKQGVAGNWFANRSAKNALGYAVAKAVVAGAMDITGSYIGAKTIRNVGSSRSIVEETRDNYGSQGEYIGGTHVSRREFKGQNR